MLSMFKDSLGIDMFQQRTATFFPWFHRVITPGLLLAFAAFGLPAHAGPQAPDAFMQQLSNELMEVVRKDPAVKSADMQKLVNLVDIRVLPNVNFQRMTASAVGPAWRKATPEQLKRLQEEFKMLLVRSMPVLCLKPKTAIPLWSKVSKAVQKTTRWWCALKFAVVTSLFLWTTGWRKIPTRQAVG